MTYFTEISKFPSEVKVYCKIALPSLTDALYSLPPIIKVTTPQSTKRPYSSVTLTVISTGMFTPYEIFPNEILVLIIPVVNALIHATCDENLLFP